ncbi:ferredoxin [Thermoproteota archaeon]
MIKVTHEPEECIGCSACAAMCEKHFEMNDEEMKVHIKDGKKLANGKEVIELDDAEMSCIMEAAESCPVNCIHVFLNDEKKI